MKKIFTLFAAVLCGMMMNAKTLYLAPGVWEADNAKFALYYFNDGQEGVFGDYMTKTGDVYQGSISWESKWNQTEDLVVPADKNLYTISDWGGDKSPGEWSVYGNGGGNENPGGQGGETPGGQGGTQSGAKDYYLRGYFNGVDTQVPTAEELFENGVLADFTFTGDGNGLGYFYVMECDEGQVVGVDYMLTEYIAGTHGTLVKGGNQKLGVQAGTVTFYLYDNGDGSLELSTEVIAGKTLVGGGEDPNQAINQVESRKQVRKMIIDGQLRIVRGEKVFDATGRQL